MKTIFYKRISKEQEEKTDSVVHDYNGSKYVEWVSIDFLYDSNSGMIEKQSVEYKDNKKVIEFFYIHGTKDVFDAYSFHGVITRHVYTYTV